jgi:hypothetical protein
MAPCGPETPGGAGVCARAGDAVRPGGASVYNHPVEPLETTDGVAGPRLSWTGVRLPLALFVLSALCILPALLRAANIYDEGLLLVGAQRIGLGEVPYRDFWNTHSPGQIATVAALFRLVGGSMLVERIYDVLVRAALAVVIFSLAGRMTTRAGALAAWGLATVFLACFPYFGYVTFPALLCALSGFVALLRATNSGLGAARVRRRSLVLAGVGVACAVLFRHDLGLEATGAGLVVILVDLAAGRGRPGWPRGPAARLGDTVSYLLGAAVVIVPVLAIFSWLDTPWPRVREIFYTYPFLVYPHFRALPLPSTVLGYATIAVPAAVLLAGLVHGLIARLKVGGGGRLAPLLPLALTGILAFPQSYTRPAAAQQVAVVLLAITILPGLAAVAAGSGRRRRALVFACGAAALGAMVRVPLSQSFRDVRAAWPHGTTTAAHDLERARLVPLEASQAEAVRAVLGMTGEGDAIFVGLGRHDKAYSNDALFYFLAGRRCATYYHNLLPGLVTTAAVQREVLADLKHGRVRLVVLYTGFDAMEEPNESRLSSSVDLLDRGIRSDYARSRVIGPYEIWELRTGDAPNSERNYNPTP